VQAMNAATGASLEVAYPGCDLSVTVEFECHRNFAHANVAIIFYDSSGYRIIDTNTAQKGEFVSMEAGQTGRASFLLHELLVKPGKYLIGLWLGREGVESIDDIEHAVTMDVAEGEESRNYPQIYPGTYLCRFEEQVSILEPGVMGPQPREVTARN